MNGIKWNFLFLAILAALSIIGMGFSLGAGSPVGMIVCLIILISVMGYGFATKKKYREAGKL
ncbi:protein YlaF [Bacillus freudenreichii]|nr:protein YlaF [Bacillus freudenreichii]